MKIQTPKHFFSSLIICLAAMQSAHGLSIINGVEGSSDIEVEISAPYSTADINTPGSCRKNRTWAIWKIEKLYPLKEISTGVVKNEQRMCVTVEYKWDTNPVRDVPECVLQIMNAGQGIVKATPACEYKGKCPNDKDYNSADKDCCPSNPSNYWDSKSNSCKNFPVPG